MMTLLAIQSLVGGDPFPCEDGLFEEELEVDDTPAVDVAGTSAEPAAPAVEAEPALEPAAVAEPEVEPEAPWWQGYDGEGELAEEYAPMVDYLRGVFTSPLTARITELETAGQGFEAKRRELEAQIQRQAQSLEAARIGAPDPETETVRSENVALKAELAEIKTAREQVQSQLDQINEARFQKEAEAFTEKYSVLLANEKAKGEVADLIEGGLDPDRAARLIAMEHGIRLEAPPETDAQRLTSGADGRPSRAAATTGPEKVLSYAERKQQVLNKNYG